MASMKGRLFRIFAESRLNRSTVDSIEDIGGFRRVGLRCQDEPTPAGSKLQVLLPSNDVRTYTPIPIPGGFLLLGWKHAGGPGAHWLSEIGPGDELRYVGPQRSLEIPLGPVIVIGDETSIALAASFEHDRPGQIRAVIASDSGEVAEASESVGLSMIRTAPPVDTDHIADLVESAMQELPGAVIAITGGSELVLRVRSSLRARGLEKIKAKAYWIPGKTGLD
ncbi:hypothetical protein SAMN05428989_3111 [Pseudoxanthomonas sp. GM95]|uniref:hypothetical protein n=1 Tax=Pseudoxanthomonas sp. GM95 TaxID=1881043 RepID=UPI0008D0B9F2|nr:hypothetical protein [Pseudoxanthomonas sp. GM95]SEM12150.1 hypothetical protein SAMN05428989_3111 [Pseudoxanthomonas sp. GM95]